ncbi:DgyrCDS3415 [Dimorphilus gyrociliatus]|uniref:DgyrCDS3415 n=1 Tax=Dimorphilus gyrociliatus TaxID=2664684 RepID=A0A7I8VD46_9ANNE|nr:DgyrCDS3415 [Dimorphilus gyrociliatus]
MVGDSKGKGKDKGKSKKGKGDAPDAETPDHQEVVSPLLDESERLDGKILLVGNRNLINLNLSHNEITEIGLKELDNALGFQISHTILADKKLGNQGLMRLCIQKNNIPSDNEYVLKIKQKMISRDPFFKQQKSPDEESTGQRSASKVSDKSK